MGSVIQILYIKTITKNRFVQYGPPFFFLSCKFWGFLNQGAKDSTLHGLEMKTLNTLVYCQLGERYLDCLY